MKHSMCKKKPTQPEVTTHELDLSIVKSIQGGADNAIQVDLKVNKTPLHMELDTGTDVT